MSDLLETFADGVLTLTMNRPEARNALTGEMMSGLREAVPRAAADPKVRCLVLTGAGGAFCAGGDVKDFASSASASKGKAEGDAPSKGPSTDERIYSLRSSMEVSRYLHEMPKPTLAVIPGPAAGAGLSLALACDLRLALDTAKITTAFSRIGLSGDYGGSYFLPQLVGAAKARELYFTADVITGQEAFDLGLVNKVAGKEGFEKAAQDYARYLAGLPTIALGYMKKNLNAAENGVLSDVFDLEASHMVRGFQTQDHKGAAVAFVKKEQPVFAGR